MVSRSSSSGGRPAVSAAEAARAFALGRALAAPSVCSRPSRQTAGFPHAGDDAARPLGYARLLHARPSSMAAAATGWGDMHRTPPADTSA
ncbi:hypothetical protein ACFYYS_01845 [Streptomyces sp. NPDC002120]|uniref:hypothetical protein n=1 Tax=Streptomyces sp. NPDC002120 TaxID=3364631 RepID=UPI0036BC0864